MKSKTEKLDNLQQLVLEVMKVERNHSIPNTERHENVVEHSFSVAMLCWKVFEMVKPPLSLEKILKYALLHDFPERGVKSDTNTYAGKEERKLKKEREALELDKISNEFKDFEDFVKALHDYEKLDDEALFVWSVDKMQSVILGGMDNWRPYASYGITYKQFCEKNLEIINKGSVYVKDIFTQVHEEACKTYYDNPNKKSKSSN